MASKKEGGKNRKIGRHSRNPSSANQAKRTERNKAAALARAKAANPKGLGHTIPERYRQGNQHMLHSPQDTRYGWRTLEFRGQRTRVYFA